MAEGTKGIVYIFTHPRMHGLVKIGIAKDLDERLRSLSSHSGVPGKFKCEYAKSVSNARKIEKLLHKAFTKFREGTSEFFEIETEHAIAALELASGRKINVKKKTSTKKQVTKKQPTKRRPRFDFVSIGIAIGETITYHDDDNITAKVITDTTILFRGEEVSLTKATMKVLGRPNTMSGLSHWKYKGEYLTSRRDRIENERRRLRAPKDESDKKQTLIPRSPYIFSTADIPIGATLTFTKDKTITAKVVNDTQIRFRGEVMSLSEAARIILKVRKKLLGPQLWKYQDERLKERRERILGPRLSDR